MFQNMWHITYFASRGMLTSNFVLLYKKEINLVLNSISWKTNKLNDSGQRHH